MSSAPANVPPQAAAGALSAPPPHVSPQPQAPSIENLVSEGLQPAAPRVFYAALEAAKASDDMQAADGPGEYTPAEWSAWYVERDQRAQLLKQQQELLAQQQLAAYHRMAGVNQGLLPLGAAAPEMPPPPPPPIVHPGNILLARQPVAAPLSQSVSGAGQAAPAIHAIRVQFLVDHAVPGEAALVAHEGTQLAIACRLAAESMNYVFQDHPWLSPSDVAATTLSWSSLQGDGVPPLPQVLWHHVALIVAFLATEDSLPQVVDRMRYVQKQVLVGEIHLVVLCSTDRCMTGQRSSRRRPPGPRSRWQS